MSAIRVAAIPAPCTQEIAERFAALHARCFEGAVGADWSAAAISTILAMPGACGWLLQHRDEAAGFVLARAAGDDCEILTIVVDPECRHSGCGRALLTAVALWAKAAGLERLILEVAVSNDAARALYESCNFSEQGRRAGYYRVGRAREDALVLAVPPHVLIG